MDPRYEFGTKEFYMNYAEKNKEKEIIEALIKYLVENDHLTIEEATEKVSIMLKPVLDKQGIKNGSKK